MPVRIYEIAKRLGLENKLVLSKALELGIKGAKVPSSTLDKITAEYLEEQLRPLAPPPVEPPAPVPAPEAQKPAEGPPPEAPPEVAAPPTEAPLAAPPLVEAAPAPPPPEAPVLQQPVEAETPPVPAVMPEVLPAPAVVVELPPPTAVEVAVEPPPVEAVSPPPAPAPQPPPAPEPAPPEVVPAPVAEAVPAPPAPPPPPPAPPAPPPPPKVPELGALLGRITLPGRPGQRTADKAAPGRTSPGARPAAGARGRDQRVQRGTGQRQDAAAGRGAPAQPAKPAAPKVVLPDGAQTISLKPPIVVRDLADKLGKRPFKLIADLMGMGVFANVNQTIDEPTAQRVCALYGFKFEVEKRQRDAGIHRPVAEKKADLDAEDDPKTLKPRAPVVTIMGHVDHGKTSLLDVIRKSNVVAGEAGGITQHIGAYTISFPHPDRRKELAQITFLDTPGHAAFSAMRARGANVTDIVVLVVAANDGVMPQTLEALAHAQAAKVPILVAVNKCDHPNANAMKVRQQLQDKGLVPDDWGGDTIFVNCSALTKEGVDKLIEMLLLQADLLELKANPNRAAKGNVIESGLEPGGPTATVLVRKGTLKVGAILLCGQYLGKVRALINEEGKRLKEAGPSVAVKVLGLNGVPEAGSEFTVVEDEKAARELAQERAQEARIAGQEARAKVTLENLFDTLAATEAKVLKVVVKADTQGSVEAIVEALKKVESQKVNLEVIASAVGTISENDVLLASASNAVILGFHTRVDTAAAELAKREGVQIKLYTIIYELIDQVKEAMAGLLEPIIKEVVVGVAEVKKVFEMSKGAPVAGCMVTNGRILRGKVRVLRRKHVIYEGATHSLRRFQDEVNEVRAGMECGIRLESFAEFQEGDTIECYTVERVTQKL